MQSRQSQYTPKVLPPDPVDTPIILVHDHTEEPVITTHYINGDNELNFACIYKSIKSLLKHPACSHRPSEAHWPCPPCCKVFSTLFWKCACRLLDYFADFLAHDSGRMASLWFYLLDIWQETYVWFPCSAVLSGSRAESVSEATLVAARIFMTDFRATVELFDTVLYGAKGSKKPREKLIYSPDGDTRSPAGVYNTGPWVSGLKPWEQFLCKRSPGVVGFREDKDESKGEVRYVPMAAIGIIKKHTERARQLAVQVNPDQEFLNAFDQHSLQLPQSTGSQSYAYRSLDGGTTTYRLVNGAPPITRYPGYGDPHHLSSTQTFTLLDEFVGQCREVTAYEPVSGDEDAEDDDIETFDMWAVSQRKDVGHDEKKNTLAEGWKDMFDELCKKSPS